MRLIHSFVHLESLERSIEKRMEALGEESLGTIFHGGLKEAQGLIILWCGFLLGGGRTLGGGRKLSRHQQLLSFCKFDWWRFGTAYKHRFSCKGFSNNLEKIKGASIQWNMQQGREGALAWAHSSWNLLAKLERSLLLLQVPLYLFTCCFPCLRHHIYTLSL